MALLHGVALVGRQIVDDDDIAALERWPQTLLDVGEEVGPGHWPINNKGRDHLLIAKPSYEGDSLPMPLRNIADQSLAARAAAPQPYHIGAGCGFIDEHQSGRVKQALIPHPAPTCPRHVRSLLFRRVQAFF